jgi:DinB family
MCLSSSTESNGYNLFPTGTQDQSCSPRLESSSYIPQPMSGWTFCCAMSQPYLRTSVANRFRDSATRPFGSWHEEDWPTVAALQAAKDRIREATRAYVRDLTEEQLNTTLRQRPVDWGGELRSPAFILLHVITHTFHHKGQIVAMLRILGCPAPDTDLQQV